MSDRLPTTTTTAAALRQAFDASFAVEAATRSETLTDLLAVRVADAPYAVRLREISGVVAHRQIVSLPSAGPALLGLAGIRGEVVPVFSLSVLLGHGPEDAPPGWLVLCGETDTVALAFSVFEGFLRLPRSALHADERDRASHPLIDEIAGTDAGPRPVIRMPGLLEGIRRRPGRARPGREE